MAGVGVIAVLLLALVGGDISGAMAKLHVPGLFMFGDSLLDVGTNSYIPGCDITSNFPPYGESYFNPPTGRFSNGRISPDYYAEFIGLPTFPEPFIKPGASFQYGINFASAGSGLLNATRSSDLVTPISTQLLQFDGVKPWLIEKYGPELITKSIYIISSANNDLQVYYGNTTATMTIPLENLVDQLVHELEIVIKTIFEGGGRKIIIYAIGPLGCLPYMRAINPDQNVNVYGCKDVINNGVVLFNSKLFSLVNKLDLEHKDMHLVYVDSYKVIYDLIREGGKYGFTEMSTACCGGGLFNGLAQCGTYDKQGKPLYTLCSNATLPQYVFFDYFHPATKVSKLTSELSWYPGKSNTAHPISIQELAEL